VLFQSVLPRFFKVASVLADESVVLGPQVICCSPDILRLYKFAQIMYTTRYFLLHVVGVSRGDIVNLVLSRSHTCFEHDWLASHVCRRVSKRIENGGGCLRS